MAKRPGSAIVHYEHRYKPPPKRKQKAVALGVSAIVTARKPGMRVVEVPDMTPEEHKRRGEAADALWRDMVRAVAAKRG